MSKIIIYTKDFCPYCDRAKNLLKNKGAAFEEINVEGNDAMYEQLKATTGHRTVPQIFINSQMIGGFTELNHLSQTGELDRMLAAGAAAAGSTNVAASKPSDSDRAADSEAPAEL